MKTDAQIIEAQTQIKQLVRSHLEEMSREQGLRFLMLVELDMQLERLVLRGEIAKT